MSLHLHDTVRRPIGAVDLWVWQGDRLIEQWQESKNVVVDGAASTQASLVGGTVANNSVTQIGYGTGSGAANTSNTGLTSAFLKPVDGISYPAAGQVQFDFSLGSAEDNGVAIYEFGLITAGGGLFARKVRSAALNKASDISLSGHWTITF